MSVGIGLTLTRSTMSWPFEIPPSMPPARFEPRATAPSSSVKMSWAAEPGSEATSRPDFDRLYGLHSHHGPGEDAVEARVGLAVRAHARGDARDADREGAAEGIARGFGGVDRRDHARFGPGIRAPDLACVRPVDIDRGQFRRDDVADLRNVRGRSNSERLEELRADRPEGYAHRRLASARSFQDVAEVALTVFHGAGVVGMAGARVRKRLTAAGQRVHQFANVFEVFVTNEDRDRRSKGASSTQAGEELHLVRFDFHPAAAAVAALTCAQRRVDGGDVDDEVCGEAVEDADERRTVRFARREIPEHGAAFDAFGRPSAAAAERRPFSRHRSKASTCRVNPSFASMP
jgi:hypothetical protein